MIACKNKNDDSSIQQTVSEKLPIGISATVQDGVVTLTGSCPDENCKTEANKAASDVDGVKSVNNNISVSIIGNESVNISPDDMLMSDVNAVVNEYPSVNASVKDGVVTLTGSIQRSSLQDLMQKVQALNPAKVENQLVINN
jgi:osmotically-inducible protein OsmY